MCFVSLSLFICEMGVTRPTLTWGTGWGGGGQCGRDVKAAMVGANLEFASTGWWGGALGVRGSPGGHRSHGSPSNSTAFPEAESKWARVTLPGHAGTCRDPALQGSGPAWALLLFPEPWAGVSGRAGQAAFVWGPLGGWSCQPPSFLGSRNHLELEASAMEPEQ